ncbi:PREDICTED: flagellar attachment zone protein 1-like isoform X2 [Priapulus caudatus]|uniref:Flagellar attachment zone protein 1-like isoform X2 n=1 Tax=Priapulus caudatus TaxID=37621 RepID=A0ABM1E6X3_PRICU|nr:PREDICTED: flagellar attachment zone protein 1-like isoform X2 [Priapulus caudatus]
MQELRSMEQSSLKDLNAKHEAATAQLRMENQDLKEQLVELSAENKKLEEVASLDAATNQRLSETVSVLEQACQQMEAELETRSKLKLQEFPRLLAEQQSEQTSESTDEHPILTADLKKLLEETRTVLKHQEEMFAAEIVTLHEEIKQKNETIVDLKAELQARQNSLRDLETELKVKRTIATQCQLQSSDHASQVCENCVGTEREATRLQQQVDILLRRLAAESSASPAKHQERSEIEDEVLSLVEAIQSFDTQLGGWTELIQSRKERRGGRGEEVDVEGKPVPRLSPRVTDGFRYLQSSIQKLADENERLKTALQRQGRHGNKELEMLEGELKASSEALKRSQASEKELERSRQEVLAQKASLGNKVKSQERKLKEVSVEKERLVKRNKGLEKENRSLLSRCSSLRKRVRSLLTYDDDDDDPNAGGHRRARSLSPTRVISWSPSDYDDERADSGSLYERPLIERHHLRSKSLHTTSRLRFGRERPLVRAPSSTTAVRTLQRRVKQLRSEVARLRDAKVAALQTAATQQATVGGLRTELAACQQQNRLCKLKERGLMNEVDAAQRCARQLQLEMAAQRDERPDPAHTPDEWKVVEGRLKSSTAEVRRLAVMGRSMKAEKESQEGQVRDLQDKLRHIERDSANKRTLIESYKERLRLAQGRVKDLEDRHDMASLDGKQASEENARLKVKIESLKMQLSATQQERKVTERKMEEVTSQLSAAQHERKVTERKMEEVTSKLSAAQHERKLTSRKLEEVYGESKVVEGNMERYKAELFAAQHERKMLNGELEAMKTQLSTTLCERKVAGERLEEGQHEKEALVAKLEKVQQALQQQEKEVFRQQEQLQAAQVAFACTAEASAKQASDAEQTWRHLHADVENARTVIDEFDKSIMHVVTELCRQMDAKKARETATASRETSSLDASLTQAKLVASSILDLSLTDIDHIFNMTTDESPSSGRCGSWSQKLRSVMATPLFSQPLSHLLLDLIVQHTADVSQCLTTTVSSATRPDSVCSTQLTYLNVSQPLSHLLLDLIRAEHS